MYISHALDYNYYHREIKFSSTSLPRVHAQGGKVISRVVVVVVVISTKIAISQEVRV